VLFSHRNGGPKRALARPLAVRHRLHRHPNPVLIIRVACPAYDSGTIPRLRATHDRPSRYCPEWRCESRPESRPRSRAAIPPPGRRTLVVAREASTMRFQRILCLMVSVLVASCGSGGSATDAGGGGTTCTGRQAVCAGHPYAACVEVQQSLGHCVDWSMVGASACSIGPQDCPATRPSASFPASVASPSSAVCVKATDILFSTGAASPGYCAALQAYSDPSGAATCTPNPCGAAGYCSYVHTSTGSVVSCMWAI
jgi:hypothetical protein